MEQQEIPDACRVRPYFLEEEVRQGEQPDDDDQILRLHANDAAAGPVHSHPRPGAHVAHHAPEGAVQLRRARQALAGGSLRTSTRTQIGASSYIRSEEEEEEEEEDVPRRSSALVVNDPPALHRTRAPTAGSGSCGAPGASPPPPTTPPPPPPTATSPSTSPSHALSPSLSSSSPPGQPCSSAHWRTSSLAARTTVCLFLGPDA